MTTAIAIPSTHPYAMATTTFPTSNIARPLSAVDLIALVLLIVGGLNWGLVGIFNFDLVATIFGAGTTLSRFVYAVVGLAALWTILITVRLAKRV